ncbi:hypothetical protein B0J14DRAFT_580607 [Halenospora varia]|nr:hypothetical protein B0J14DRAFT_580607 [Halenospora varia]
MRYVEAGTAVEATYAMLEWGHLFAGIFVICLGALIWPRINGGTLVANARRIISVCWSGLGGILVDEWLAIKMLLLLLWSRVDSDSPVSNARGGILRGRIALKGFPWGVWRLLQLFFTRECWHVQTCQCFPHARGNREFGEEPLFLWSAWSFLWLLFDSNCWHIENCQCFANRDGNGGDDNDNSPTSTT